jgi:methylthioribulose-1-phosphate dehydratase
MLTPDAFPEQAAALCEVGRAFGARQWVLATGGNLSCRIDGAHFLVTQSGTDKSSLRTSDLMICDLDGKALDPKLKPSAETPMHALLYRRDTLVHSVLHTHSVASTLLSKYSEGDISARGYEMQKALTGVTSHEERLTIPVVDNDQDMGALSLVVEKRLTGSASLVSGFFVRGHGLYGWGKSIAQAKRHVEGLEFIAHCLWQERLAGTHES